MSITGRMKNLGRAGVVVGVMALTMISAGTALGGGAWMQPVADRYEPGEIATMVGYFGGGSEGADRPIFISSLPYDSTFNLPESSERIRVGVLVTEQAGPGSSLYRASTTFKVPGQLEPGAYEVGYDWENGFTGDLIGGTLFVSSDPTHPISREWPGYETEIANLADSAILVYGGGTITAGELRAGLNFQATTTIPPRPPTLEAAPVTVAVPVAASEEQPPFPDSLVPVDEEIQEIDPLLGQDIEPAGSTAPWALGSAVLALLALGFVVVAARRRKLISPKAATRLMRRGKISR